MKTAGMRCLVFSAHDKNMLAKAADSLHHYLRDVKNTYTANFEEFYSGLFHIANGMMRCFDSPIANGVFIAMALICDSRLLVPVFVRYYYEEFSTLRDVLRAAAHSGTTSYDPSFIDEFFSDHEPNFTEDYYNSLMPCVDNEMCRWYMYAKYHILCKSLYSYSNISEVHYHHGAAIDVMKEDFKYMLEHSVESE